jgi:hypothetical protein
MAEQHTHACILTRSRQQSRTVQYRTCAVQYRTCAVQYRTCAVQYRTAQCVVPHAGTVIALSVTVPGTPAGAVARCLHTAVLQPPVQPPVGGQAHCPPQSAAQHPALTQACRSSSSNSNSNSIDRTECEDPIPERHPTRSITGVCFHRGVLRPASELFWFNTCRMGLLGLVEFAWLCLLSTVC